MTWWITGGITRQIAGQITGWINDDANEKNMHLFLKKGKKMRTKKSCIFLKKTLSQGKVASPMPWSDDASQLFFNQTDLYMGDVLVLLRNLKTFPLCPWKIRRRLLLCFCWFCPVPTASCLSEWKIGKVGVGCEKNYTHINLMDQKQMVWKDNNVLK